MTDNIVKYGVGAFNIDACRVDLKGEKIVNGGGNNIQFNTSGNGTLQEQHYKSKLEQTINTQGRHPANLVLSDGWKHYEVKDNVTVKQLKELEIWLNENS